MRIHNSSVRCIDIEEKEEKKDGRVEGSGMTCCLFVCFFLALNLMSSKSFPFQEPFEKI